MTTPKPPYHEIDEALKSQGKQTINTEGKQLWITRADYLLAALSESMAREKKARAEAFAEAAKLSETWKPPCADTGHDERWCGNCSAMEAGIDLFGQELLARAARDGGV